MKLIVGLGNPGNEYRATRHNLGWTVLDALVAKCGTGEWRTESSFESELADTQVGSERVYLAKPTTFMNNSGRAVATLARFYKVGVEDILLIHDELDLPLGTVRMRIGGSAAGHHGVESVAHHMSSDQFWRLRCGIAPVNRIEGGQASSFVLTTFSSEERELVVQVADRAASLVYDGLVSGILTEATVVIPRVGGSEITAA